MSVKAGNDNEYDKMWFYNVIISCHDNYVTVVFLKEM